MKKEKNEQIRRIKQMEKRLNRASSAVRRFSSALDKFEDVQDAIATLDDYYGCELWRKDFADDEAGLLPDDLKRGVLSEDAVWNFLSDYRELINRLKGFVETKK